MSKPNDILVALIAQLQASSALSYVQDSDIVSGLRDNIMNFPSLMVISNGDQVKDYDYPYEKIVQKFKIFGIVEVYDKDNSQTDSGTQQGILTLKNDVKKALTSAATLGVSDVIDTTCPSSQDDDGMNFPTNGFVMDVEVLYQQNRFTRA